MSQLCLTKRLRVGKFNQGIRCCCTFPLQNGYFGLYVVHKRVNDNVCVLNTPDRDRKSRYCHLNLLKGYVDTLPKVPVLPVQIEIHSIPIGDTSSADIRFADIRLSISQYPAPTKRREVRRFLDMAGYYRPFCANFSTVAAPITSKFQWSDGCEK